MEEGAIRVDMGSHAICQTIIDWFMNSVTIIPTTDEKPALLIRAKSIHTLEEEIQNENLLTFHETIRLFSDIAGQLNGLERNSFSPSQLNLSSISVVKQDNGDRIFMLSPNTRLYEIHSDSIEINHPFKKHMFMSPELVATKTLPVRLSASGAAYSLGVIAYYCLAETIISPDNKSRKLRSMSGTPLSAAIERTIHADPDKRRLLYI